MCLLLCLNEQKQPCCKLGRQPKTPGSENKKHRDIKRVIKERWFTLVRVERTYSLVVWLNADSRLFHLISTARSFYPGARSNLFTCFRADPLMQLFSYPCWWCNYAAVLLSLPPRGFYLESWAVHLRRDEVQVTAPSWTKSCKDGLCGIGAVTNRQHASSKSQNHLWQTKANLALMPTWCPFTLPSAITRRWLGFQKGVKRAACVAKRKSASCQMMTSKWQAKKN